jgi:Arc/MetJ family transcription regulator
MRRYLLKTKREAVIFALRALAAELLSLGPQIAGQDTGSPARERVDRLLASRIARCDAV